MPDDSFPYWLERLRQGDEAAARRIFDLFAHRLIGLARAKLDAAILQKVGAEDVVQSALFSFFRRDAAKPFDLSSWDNLWSLLAVITLRKCGHKIDHYRAACRNVALEVGSLDLAEVQTSVACIAREPSPAEVAMLEETLGQLLYGLDDREREVVRQTLDGRSVAEISSAVGRSEYRVRKVMNQVRQRWERMSEGAGGA